MKKAISIILNILSIISAAVLLLFAVFCIYDWIKYSDTTYMYSMSFWMIIDLYAKGMLIPSLTGLVTTIPNIFIATKPEAKTRAKVLTVAFAIFAVISIVLYILPVGL